MSPVLTDEMGLPILLAEVPNAGVSSVDPNAKSGNPLHDKNSGKFSEGGGGPQTVNPLSPPDNVDPMEWKRRVDAVRDAAREFDQLAIGDIKEFLAGRSTRELDPGELDQFLADVNEQRITDAVDILDRQIRTKDENFERGRRTVKLQAPRGWVKSVISTLDDDRLAEIINRLQARGHDRAKLEDELLHNRAAVSENRYDSIKTKTDEKKPGATPPGDKEAVVASGEIDAWSARSTVNQTVAGVRELLIDAGLLPDYS